MDNAPRSSAPDRRAVQDRMRRSRRRLNRFAAFRTVGLRITRAGRTKVQASRSPLLRGRAKSFAGSKLGLEMTVFGRVGALFGMVLALRQQPFVRPLGFRGIELGSGVRL